MGQPGSQHPPVQIIAILKPPFESPIISEAPYEINKIFIERRKTSNTRTTELPGLQEPPFPILHANTFSAKSVYALEEEAAMCTGAQLMILVNTLTLQVVILIIFDP